MDFSSRMRFRVRSEHHHHHHSGLQTPARDLRMATSGSCRVPPRRGEELKGGMT